MSDYQDIESQTTKSNELSTVVCMQLCMFLVSSIALGFLLMNTFDVVAGWSLAVCISFLFLFLCFMGTCCCKSTSGKDKSVIVLVTILGFLSVGATGYLLWPTVETDVIEPKISLKFNWDQLTPKSADFNITMQINVTNYGHFAFNTEHTLVKVYYNGTEVGQVPIDNFKLIAMGSTIVPINFEKNTESNMEAVYKKWKDDCLPLPLKQKTEVEVDFTFELGFPFHFQLGTPRLAIEVDCPGSF